MKDGVIPLALDRSLRLQEQITEQLRAMLAGGTLRPGTRLPSTEALARQWQTHVPYVHAALKPLVVEGWLERRHGSGTFVSEKPRALRTVGIYFYGGTLADSEHRFMRRLQESLIEKIERTGRRWSVWNDPRPPEHDIEMWAELDAAVRRRELDALVVPSLDWQHYLWLSRLSIPMAVMGSAEAIVNRVDTDIEQMTRLGVESLARQGCRSIGLISAWPAQRGPDSHSERDTQVYRTFLDVSHALGLKTRAAWTITGDTPAIVRDTSERWGYDAFQRLWAQAKHPDGLFVTTDAEALGVTMAILERGVRVPDELRLAMHKNEGIDLLCPFPVTHIVGRPTEAAKALLDIVERQFAGKPTQPVIVGFHAQASEGFSGPPDRKRK